MRVRLLLAAMITAATPGLALAMGCSGYGHEQVTMSCPEGQTFDVSTESCKPLPTG